MATDRKASPRTRDLAARHSAILEAALDCIITIDDEGRVLEFNPAAERTFGYTRDEAIGRPIDALIIPPNLRSRHRRGLARFRATGEARVLNRRIEIDAMRADGTIFPAELAISSVELAGRQAFTAYLRDISERRESERRLEAANERYRRLVESLPTVVYEAEFGANGAWRYVSPQIEQLLGFPPEAWVTDPTLWYNQIHVEDRQQALIQEQALLAKPIGEPVVSEYRMLTRAGRIVWVRDEAVIVTDGSAPPTHMRGVILDITERKGLEARLSRHAFYDSLTGLPNRALFMERLERAIAHLHREPSGMVAVLFLDLDNFKVVNDTLGHGAGDVLLTRVANRLVETARAADTPARLGGDEFTILLEGLDEPADALQMAARVSEQLAAPMQIEGRDLVTTVSIGIGLSADGRVTAEELVGQADIAMYRAKQNGKAQAQLFDAQMSEEAWRRLELERELRHAIDKGELELRYQPVVDLESGAMQQVEALVRWNHPQRGWLPPDAFVPFAESTGLITGMDHLVLRTACRQLADWISRHESAAQLTVAVNLSPRQFRTPGIVEVTASVLDETGLDPARLKFEITESVAVLDSETTTMLIRTLKSLGVGVVMDDFGVGYSGLDYVKRFDVDGIKIDRSFVAGLGKRREDTAIVAAATAFARALDLSIVAEGIESVDQLRRLRKLGCRSGQGYLLSPPLAAAEVDRLLRTSVLLLPLTPDGRSTTEHQAAVATRFEPPLPATLNTP